jgi:hypothetical protein
LFIYFIVASIIVLAVCFSPPDQGQQAFSFPGGLVLPYDELVSLASEIGVTGSFVPPRFPNSAGVRFAWLGTGLLLLFLCCLFCLLSMLTHLPEIYPWRESDPNNVPLEFLFMPADFRIPLWTSVQAEDQEQQMLYLQTAKLFSN